MNGLSATLGAMVPKRGTRPVEVYIEVSAKRTFACAFEWPGWCRSGKTEELALGTLADYAPRYALVAAAAGVPFDVSPDSPLQVRERLEGNATTDFGAPAAVPTVDHEPLTGGEAWRLVGILQAAWSVFAGVVATAPAELRKGPRGGGRDRDAIADHVVAAEFAVTREIGLRNLRQTDAQDAEAVAAMRQAITEALLGAVGASPPADRTWPPRYAFRRITWHALDHAWEIEDRSEPASA